MVTARSGRERFLKQANNPGGVGYRLDLLGPAILLAVAAGALLVGLIPMPQPCCSQGMAAIPSVSPLFLSFLFTVLAAYWFCVSVRRRRHASQSVML
jgi:hypothetical protein